MLASRIACAALFAAAVLLCSQQANAEARVALVIGNSDYGPAIGKLKNPVNDAKLMTATLKSLGFTVETVLNADQKTMKKAIKAFGSRLQQAGKGATGLFYYAGHGVQVEGANFLLPVGAEIEKESDVEIESIAADDVMTQMQFAGNAVNLVFLDACRNNPLARSSRSVATGLARLDAPRGSFVGYSTAPGDVAADGEGANSLYAIALSEELKKPGISIEEAHRNVRARVLAETGQKQTPWDSSSLTGAVVLAGLTPEVAGGTNKTAQPSTETVYWESIKNSSDPNDFNSYLKRYPGGPFADLAKNRLKALQAKATTAPAMTQSAATKSIEPGTTEAALSQQQRKQIELALLNEKINPGGIDGNFDHDTRVAIKTWQYNSGMQPTGTLSPEQIAKLVAKSGGAGSDKKLATYERPGEDADPRLQRAFQSFQGRPFTYGEYEGHIYVAVQYRVMFEEAQQAAEAAGGHLASIASKKENEAVFDLIKDDPRFWDISPDGFVSGPFIGMYQTGGAKSSKDNWVWPDGTEVDYDNWSESTKQPNEVDLGEGPGAAMYGGLNDSRPTSEWNDAPFFKQGGSGYVIELD